MSPVSVSQWRNSYLLVFLGVGTLVGFSPYQTHSEVAPERDPPSVVA